MKTVSNSTNYLGIIIEYTADVYLPGKDVGYTFPTIENLEIRTFTGEDWEVISVCLTEYVINSIEMRCREHAIEIAMSEELA